MRKTLLVFISLLSLMPLNLLHAESVPVDLFMADGQLKSHPIRVFISQDIADSMKPRLVLTASHVISPKRPEEQRFIEPMLVARHQTVEQVVNEAKIALTGTLLLFDLSHYPVPFYKTVVRLTPTLIWQDELNNQQVAIGGREVYLSNTVPAFVIPCLLVFLLLSVLIGLAKLGNKQPIQFICGNDGALSLSRAQVMLWTLAIGCMVMAYGLMRLQVPTIPESLIALMGLSLATGGISYAQGEKAAKALDVPAEGEAWVNRQPRLSDLVVDYSVRGQGNLSMTRAQMVFWTLFTLLLFVTKSILEGDLWDVPWELVALMGLSQISYLAPKINQPETSPTSMAGKADESTEVGSPPN